MDDPERDKSVAPAPEVAGESEEYELEPLDPEIVASQHRQAHDTMETTRLALDIDDIYREAERDRGGEILENWFRNVKFQFGIKQLLGVTALVAILLTLSKLGLMAVVVIAVMLGIAGVYLYLQWQDKKHQDEVNRRREAMYARRRAQRESAPLSGEAAHQPAAHVVEPPLPSPPPADDVEEAWRQARQPREFHFQFSLQQLLAAITVAAIVFGLAHLFGGPSSAATILGLIALAGLFIHALGYEPPEIVVLGWWLILVMYVLLSIVGALWAGLA
jgi:hypothetical protein